MSGMNFKVTLIIDTFSPLEFPVAFTHPTRPEFPIPFVMGGEAGCFLEQHTVDPARKLGQFSC